MEIYSCVLVNYDHTTFFNSLFLDKKEARKFMADWLEQKVKSNKDYIEFANVGEVEIDGADPQKILEAAKSADHVLVQLTDNNRLEAVITAFEFDEDEIRKAAISASLKKEVYDKIKF